MSIPGHTASYPPCTTNYTHPHIRSFDIKLLKKYTRLKQYLWTRKAMVLECDYCENFFKKKQDRSQWFLDLYNASGKKRKKMFRRADSSEQAPQNAINMCYRQSNFININLTSHQQVPQANCETANFGAANDQQIYNTNSNFPTSAYQQGTYKPVTPHAGTHKPGTPQPGSHNPGASQPDKHQSSAGAINVPKSQVTPKKKIIKLTKRQKQLHNRIDLAISRQLTTQTGSSTIPIMNKKKKKYAKSGEMMQTVYYTESGQARTLETPVFKELSEHADLTDLEVKSQNTRQPQLPQIKINIANKQFSSKTRTVNVEGKCASEAPIHPHDLNTVELHNPSSAIQTNEKHISTYKAPFHIGPTGNTIPRLIGRVVDTVESSAGTDRNTFKINPAPNSNQQNVSRSEMRSDPFQSKILCPIHHMYNCSCKNAPSTSTEMPRKSEQLKVVIPTNAETRTVYVSQESEASTDLAKIVCKRKRKPVGAVFPMVTNASMQMHKAGVPRHLGQRMVGELDAYRTEQPYGEMDPDSDSESDCKVVNEEETPDGSELPDLLMSVYQSDMQTGNANKPNEKERKPPDTQGPSKKIKMYTDDSRPPIQPDEYVSIHKRSEIICSIDKTVKSLAMLWPWEKKIKELSTVTHDGDAKQKTAFKNILQEPDPEFHSWIKIKVTGYPKHWDRHKLLDTLINWRDVSTLPLTPCFIEYTPHKCMFLVYNCPKTLSFLYYRGLVAHGDDYRMNLSITQLAITQFRLRFRLQRFLEFRLDSYYDKETKAVNLSAFLREPDISMMCHFPLNKIYNQKRLMELKIDWKNITKINLSNNQLTSLEGFNITKHLPQLQDLDIGDNWFESTSQLSCCRGAMSVKSVRLEGNPICLNFIQRDEYTDIAKFLFPNIDYLDGVKISGLLEPKRNYCPYPEAEPLVERFLELYFNLLESKSREELCNMYSAGSVLTLSCQSRLKKLPEYENLEMVRACRDVRLLNEVMDECFIGNEEISGRLAEWPPVAHDTQTFTVDVMQHTERSLVLTVSGTLRVLCQPVQEECPLLDFTRTFVMSTRDGDEYLINNDMWYVAKPTPERTAAAFTIQRPKPALSLQLEAAPDEDLKAELTEIFMKLTKLKRTESSRCLEMRNWNIRYALQYFIQLLEVNEVSMLSDIR